MFYLFLLMFLLSSKLQFLDVLMFYQALQLSLCQESPWHLRSLSPTVTAGCRSLLLRTKHAGTGQAGTPASPLHKAHGRETTDTHKLHQWWCRRRVRVSKSHRGWGHFWSQYLHKSIPSSCTKGEGALIWVCLFYPFKKTFTCFPFHMKYVRYTQLEQVHSRSKSG